ncbi:hypothetical protein PNI02_06320 [Pseudoalteromonas nigrifaciens]|nr:hypothetical protein PNI02_06320 [Pseudoalteromonas nigrifaciens]
MRHAVKTEDLLLIIIFHRSFFCKSNTSDQFEVVSLKVPFSYLTLTLVKRFTNVLNHSYI